MSPTLPAMLMAELCDALGSRARALEALRWLYAQPNAPTRLPEAIPGVSHRVWQPFAARATLVVPKVVERQVSDDGTTRYLLEFDGTQVETVRIPARNRSTVCISSQAGCTRRCVFCATQTLGFKRHLTADEMVAQYLLARAEADPGTPARNVVFMGQGEPMDNLDAVLRAVQVLTQSPAPQLKQQSVTVSTSGVLPGIERFLAESKASLALSLNATTDEVRAQLMPHTRTWPIASLLKALRDDAAAHPKRDHFIEYVLFDGVNDTDDDADRLVQLLAGVRSRINLIPHNPLRGSDLKAPPLQRIDRFHQRVISQGALCLVRWPRGRDIAAACGQLVLGHRERNAASAP